MVMGIIARGLRLYLGVPSIPVPSIPSSLEMAIHLLILFEGGHAEVEVFQLDAAAGVVEIEPDGGHSTGRRASFPPRSSC